jgi:heme oxygenase
MMCIFTANASANTAVAFRLFPLYASSSGLLKDIAFRLGIANARDIVSAGAAAEAYAAKVDA